LGETGRRLEDEVPADVSLALGRLVDRKNFRGPETMKRINSSLKPSLLVGLVLLCSYAQIWAQAANSAPQSPPQDSTTSSQPYSGMYSFLKDGEFLQLTVEEGGHVTGFISRYGDGESDKGAFLDQFFKSGKLEGNKLNFATDVVHGTAYEFRGLVERGEGKNPGDDGYFVLKGTLTENVSDLNKKVTWHSREVVFKMFPQEAGPAPPVRR